MPKRENAAVDIGQKIYEIRKAEGLRARLNSLRSFM